MVGLASWGVLQKYISTLAKNVSTWPANAGWAWVLDHQRGAKTWPVGGLARLGLNPVRAGICGPKSIRFKISIPPYYFLKNYPPFFLNYPPFFSLRRIEGKEVKSIELRTARSARARKSGKPRAGWPRLQRSSPTTSPAGQTPSPHRLAKRPHRLAKRQARLAKRPLPWLRSPHTTGTRDLRRSR